MKIIPPQIRQAAIRFCREVLAEKAIERRLDLPFSAAPVSVHMVVGHDMFRMGLLALRSFEFHTGLRWAPIIHDDGTLTEGDATELARLFPDATLIRRKQADRELAEALKAFPVCRENRLKHHWFLKVFDTRHYAVHDHYVIIDSDIVFFRRPDFILDWIERRPDDFWFMVDSREKYALARKDIEQLMGFPIWEKVNSGLDLMFRPKMDLSLVEKFLTLCAPRAREFAFLEQTIFAVVGSFFSGGMLGLEYEISWNNFRQKGAVCRHYIGPAKLDLLYIEGATSFWWQGVFR